MMTGMCNADTADARARARARQDVCHNDRKELSTTRCNYYVVFWTNSKSPTLVPHQRNNKNHHEIIEMSRRVHKYKQVDQVYMRSKDLSLIFYSLIDFALFNRFCKGSSRISLRLSLTITCTISKSSNRFLNSGKLSIYCLTFRSSSLL